MRSIGHLVLGLVLAASAASAVWAGEPAQEAEFQKRVFGRELTTGHAHACFTRAYDTAHLAAHPHQNVRRMEVLVTGVPSKGYGASYNLLIEVTFRKSAKQFQLSGGCHGFEDGTSKAGPAGAMHCGVDCDGGSIDVALDGSNSVLVAIPQGVSTEEMPNRSFGQDDKIFRVDKAALAQCLPLASDDDASEMRRGQ